MGLKPSAATARRMAPDFPLERGTLTCLSCHEVAPDCRGERTEKPSGHNLLRGPPAYDPLTFCSCCHAPEDYRPCNAHDQMEAGKPKSDTCAWCHTGAPQTDARWEEGGSYDLRAASDRLCRNCHRVAEGHPVVAHLRAVPPPEMMWYMSAREMQSKMRLPFEQLLEYVRATKRMPRSIPLDENGRITCYSCHNPHERGLLPEVHPRSVGADAKKAAHHRVRVREGKLCVACHQK